MARLSIMNDSVAHLCWRYVNKECDVNLAIEICTTTLPITNYDVRTAYLFIYEMAYRIGYAKSNLSDCMSETTYKIKKKQIRDILAQFLEEQKWNLTESRL